MAPGCDRASRQVDCVGRVDDHGIELEVLEDPIEQGKRALDLDLDVEQLPQREEQPALEGSEGDDVTDRRSRRIALDREEPGQSGHSPIRGRGEAAGDEGLDRAAGPPVFIPGRRRPIPPGFRLPGTDRVPAR